jgi:polyisoprenoid-binding protein YceI
MLMCYLRSILAVLAIVLLTLTARGAEYTVDPTHTSVVFAVSHLGYSYTYGRFNKVAGNFTFDAASPASGQFSIDIDAASLDSNDQKRDQHLRSADFFNVRQFPAIQFRSTGVRQGENGVQLSGDFTMHGVTRQITIPLRVLGTGKGPTGDNRIGFLSQFSLKRSDFGMNNMVGPIGDEVSVIVSFEGVER